MSTEKHIKHLRASLDGSRRCMTRLRQRYAALAWHYCRRKTLNDIWRIGKRMQDIGLYSRANSMWDVCFSVGRMWWRMQYAPGEWYYWIREKGFTYILIDQRRHTRPYRFGGYRKKKSA